MGLKPEVTINGDVATVKIGTGIDLNKDGQSSVKVSLVLEGDKKEVLEEVLGALKIEDLIGKLLGKN